MPEHMINVCVRILKSDGKVILLPNGAGYHAISGNSEVLIIDENLNRLKIQEEQLIMDMSAFIKSKFKSIEWSSEICKKHLTAFLVDRKNGSTYFIDGTLEKSNDIPEAQPVWYVGRYIDELLKGESQYKNYLVDIINGLMIYHGVYQTNDYTHDKDQKFKGTCFFLDTKLVLRSLGFSWDYHIKAVNELITMIEKDYGGKICIFPKTVDEVRIALEKAHINVQTGLPIKDDELREYVAKTDKRLLMLKETADNLNTILELDKQFCLYPAIDWDDEASRKHNLDANTLKDYV